MEALPSVLRGIEGHCPAGRGSGGVMRAVTLEQRCWCRVGFPRVPGEHLLGRQGEHGTCHGGLK